MTTLLTFVDRDTGRVGVLLAALAMGLALLMVPEPGAVAQQPERPPSEADIPPPPPPEPVGSDYDRVAGAHRIATAVTVSRDMHPLADTVLLARADDYADALSAAPLARRLDGPILLTSSEQLHGEVAAEIIRLGASRAILLGGSAALSETVRRQVAELVDDLDRIAGANRFDTARRIANVLGGAEVYVAEGAHADPARGWPDALAVSALAGFREVPVLLTVRDRLPAETAAALDDLGAAAATIVGGTAAVSQAVEEDLAARGVDVARLAGPDRYHTAMRVLEASDAAGMSTQRAWFVTGRNFPDSLVAGPAAARHGGVLVLVDGETLDGSPQVRDWVDAHSADISDVRFVGGPAAISRAVADELLDRLGAPPAPTFTVEDTLEPRDAPDVEAPLGAVAGEEVQVDIAVDRILFDGTRPDAEALAARWGGEILEADEADGELGLYLIAVDTSLVEVADPDALAARIKAIDPLAFGAHRVSDAATLRLLTILVEEHERGHMVSPEAVITTDGIPERTTEEASSGPGGYTVNAYEWPQLQEGGPHDTGIADVWTRMQYRGLLEPRSVRVAVIDRGFHADHERWAPVVDTARMTRRGSFGDSSGGDWHGTRVTSVLASAVNDGDGAAGPAGPVAELVLVDLGRVTTLRFRRALRHVRHQDADIAATAQRLPFPTGTHWVAKPLKRAISRTMGSGTMVVASAGNGDNDVDSERCFVKCWENDLHLPCERDGVICVGGTDTDGTSKHPSSNYSGDDGDGDVDIYAPYTVWTGPDPNTPGMVQSFGGTSYSTPLVAGSLALVHGFVDATDWVKRMWLLLGARPGTDPVHGVLDLNRAFDFVHGVNEPPQVTITGPRDGQRFPQGRTVVTEARVTDEDMSSVDLTWLLDSTEVSPPLRDLEAGTYSLQALASDNIAQTDVDQVTFTVDPPDWRVSIDRPAEDPHEIVRGQTLFAAGSAHDAGTGREADPDRLSWRFAETAGFLGRGGDIEVDTSELEPGDYTLLLHLFNEDETRVLAGDEITIRVRPPSDDDRPNVIIRRPDPGTHHVEGTDGEGRYVDLRLLAEVEDDHDTIAELDWSATWETDADSGTVTIPSGNDFTHRFYDHGGCGTSYTLTASAEDSASNHGEDRIEFRVAPEVC